MDLIKKVIGKLINKETVMYLIFGVLTTVVNFIVYRIFDGVFAAGNTAGQSAAYENVWQEALNTVLQKGFAGLIAWFAAVSFAYVTNRLFVFSERAYGAKGIAAECGRFFGARVLTGIIEILGVPLLVIIGLKAQVFGLDVAKLVVSVIVIVLNYIFSKLIVFKKNR